MTRQAASRSVAIMGPLSPAALSPWLSSSDIEQKPLPPQQGGAFLTSVLNARLRRGMETIAITSSAALTVPVMRWSGPLLRLWIVRRRLRGALRDGYREEVRALREALREAGASVTHAHWTYEYARAALAPGFPPVAVTVHDHAGHMLRLLGLRYLPHYVMARIACRRAAVLTAPSPFIAEYVARQTRRDVRVIPNLLDDALVSARQRRANHARAPTVITVASDAAFKNVRAAIVAFAQWRSRGTMATLRVIGPGLHLDGKIATWARARHLAEGVRFEGPVAHPEALEIIAGSDILLHPSLEESFGGPVMEAMALGVPIVAAREAGGCRFLLEDGVGGRLPSGRSPGEMAAALDAAWTNGDETARLVLAAASRVRAICEPDTVLRAYEDCYAQMVRSS